MGNWGTKWVTECLNAILWANTPNTGGTHVSSWGTPDCENFTLVWDLSLCFRYARLKSIGIVYFLFPSQYTMTLYLLTDDEQLHVYIVSVNLLHKVGAEENLGPMQGIILKGLLRALRGNLAFILILSLLLPHCEETLLVTPSLC